MGREKVCERRWKEKWEKEKNEGRKSKEEVGEEKRKKWDGKEE